MLKTNHELAPMEVASFFVVENSIIKNCIFTKKIQRTAGIAPENPPEFLSLPAE